jgi:hypothetical protein
MGQFQARRPSRIEPKLLPARSITSLRETAEVHPYLVVSPSDLVTLTNSLFPERRPTSGSFDKDGRMMGVRSGASSISGVSGISVPLAPTHNTRGGFDTASVVSNGVCSVISDLTSREPLLDDGSINNRYSSTPVSSTSPAQRNSSYEDLGFQVRLAIHEMCRSVGTDDVLGTCHPCAEKWAVLFISSDGKGLSTQIRHDLDDDHDYDETSSSDEDHETEMFRPDLDKDYHQLRDSILKLVEDFEIPQTTGGREKSRAFSNRTSTHYSPKKQHRPSNRVGSQSAQPYWQQSRKPYRTQESSSVPADQGMEENPQRTAQNEDGSTSFEETKPVLLAMLEAAHRQCEAQSDFINAHLYWRTLQQLHQISSLSLRHDGYASLLDIFSRGPRDSIRKSSSAIEEYDAWLVWLKQSQSRHDTTIESMMLQLKALRDKMWYVTDVRNSAAYEGARNIAAALKGMASANFRRASSPTGHKPRNMSRTSNTALFLKTDAQVMDMMTASEEHGGPNKLSDEQSEKTLKWLSQFGIENFCKGEERIHRFCLEIDTCVNKLVGDNLMDGPVLWSSELYARDKRILDGGRQKGDIYLTDVGALSISGVDGSDQGVLRGMDFMPKPRPSHRDLRAISMRNGSQQSFDSGRWSMSKASTAADIMDSQDYFGVTSPVLTIDSSTTFWSPFHTRSQSPSTSVSSFRPGTSSSTNETLKSSDGANADKQRFLLDLKQTLTSLLISDLGTLVFAKGSETDAWFSGDLGEECIERQERKEKVTRKKKKRVIEKKKSFRDLRSAQPVENSPNGGSNTNAEEVCPTMAKRSTEQGSAVPQQSNSHAEPAPKSKSEEIESLDFPYKSAFQRLLRMFSVHPNPFTKLNALFELEHLIIASLTTTPRRSPRADARPLTPPQSSLEAYDISSAQKTPQAHNISESMTHCRTRRSQSTLSPISPHRFFGQAIPAPVAPSTDTIVSTLQELFRNSSIRPKTLFRDLQFIASFVPAHILDTTPKGKAFWDAGLAALGLKQDICRCMVEIADDIVVHYTQNRQTSSAPTAVGSRGPGNPEAAEGEGKEEMRWSMQDAARMWTITAREGDPVAERELAILYLTHPELLPERMTLPLSKPSVVFKQVSSERYGESWTGGWGKGVGIGSGKKEGERGRGEEGAMCTAFHWMEASALGGDELARTYLRQREELNALP